MRRTEIVLALACAALAFALDRIVKSAFDRLCAQTEQVERAYDDLSDAITRIRGRIQDLEQAADG